MAAFSLFNVSFVLSELEPYNTVFPYRKMYCDNLIRTN